MSRLDLLMDFIKQEVQSEQQISLAQTGFCKLSTTSDSKKKRNRKGSFGGEPQNEEVATAAGLISSSKPGFACGFCDKKHETDRCVKALSMTLEERQKKIEEKRLCFRCFKGGHHASKCKAIVRCALCSRKHYPVLCPKSTNSSSTEQSDKDGDSDKKSVSASCSNQCSSDVLMYTLVTHLISQNGAVIKARLVGDPGSQRSYIKSDIIHQLKCEKTGDEWIQNILFGAVTSPVKRRGRYKVSFRTRLGGQVKTLELLERDAICGQLPKIPNGPWINELQRKGITLTDVGDGYEEIDVLLGNDLWGEVLTGKLEKLANGFIAIETIFGWVLGGPVTKAANNIATTVTSLMTANIDISGMWKLDAIGIPDPIESKSSEEKEREALAYFKETVSKEDNKYVVSLPWNDLNPETRPPTNFQVAEKRLLSTTRKLRKEEKVRDYHNVITSWEKEEFIVKVDEDDRVGHYLPHRPVFKQSTTTPVRPVFDASCRVGQNPSLNDTLHKGPNLLELIPNLLLRFREKKYGVTADIRKAFQMVKVRKEDQPFQKFLWWEDTNCKKIVIYKHLRVVFGLTCSPFLLGAVINHHLDQAEGDSVPVAQMLKSSFYVDNMVLSVNNVKEYEDLRSIAVTLLRGANMKLRQWAHSVSEEFRINDDSEEDDMIEKAVSISVLGLQWNRCDDVLSCEIKEAPATEKVTKRQILSVVSQVFDPIGFTCPALALPKMLLQKSWRKKFGWDEPMPDETKRKFNQWRDEMSLLSKIKIPRLIQLPNSTTREVHTFCDASSSFYASVCYLRSENGNQVEVKLLTAKSRLAAISQASIPRLELMACVVGVRQANLVREALQFDSIPFHFWSDSSTALAWIRRVGDWGVFIGNRVKEICKSTVPDQWHHVPGIHNPADLPSRGCSPSQLLESAWWEGPDWLWQSKENWPVAMERYNENEINQERRVTPSAAAATVNPPQPIFSSYRKNVAVWGWVIRFVKACKGEKNKSNFLSIAEMRDAEKILIRRIQKESFPDGGSSLQGLAVFKDKNDLFRVKTRLTRLKDTDDFKTPLLLPKNHPLVVQLIEDSHKYYCHGGILFLISKLREKYWIIQARRSISKVIHRCVQCKRHSAFPMTVDPAALPENRIKITEPFSTTGVDLAGPLILKDGKKAWIVLFTCAVFRGIHLDVVSSLSTEAFIGALERFISICGRPSTIYSDNGTNFVGANHLFQTLDWDSIMETSNTRQIQWIFNPPTAAWWGGWWERLVRSVKDLLKRMLGRAKLCYDDLRTCLARVAAVINDRPLTVVTEDNGDLIPLTPNIFMRGKMAGFLSETNEAEFLSEAYLAMKKLQDQVHSRFRKEYLAQLVMKANENKKQQIEIGDIVLVGSDGKKRYLWPLGVIEELLAGSDGKARVAKVKTQGGTFLRPLQRLYPLEVSRKEEIPNNKKNVQDVQDNNQETTVKTKFGRVVKSPSRYGQWLHLEIKK